MPYSVTLTEDLRGLKIEDTGEEIRENDFTPEMREVHRKLSSKYRKMRLLESEKAFGAQLSRTKLGQIKEMIKAVPRGIKWALEQPVPTKEQVGGFLQKIAPGKELARGIGYTLAMPEVTRWEKRSQQRQQELQDTLVQKMKEAREDKDTDRIERLRKAAQQTESSSILESVLEEAPTARQVVASSAELALLFSLGYKPYLKGAGYVPKVVAAEKKAKFLFKGAEALKKMGLAKKIGLKFVKPVATEAGRGATFFGAMKAREKEATVQDIIKAAETGALIGGGLTAGMIITGTAARLAAPKVGKAIRKGILGLEKAAAPKPPKPLVSQLDETLSYIGEKRTLKQKVAKGLLKPVEMGRRFKIRWLDRFDPLYRMENRMIETKGAPLKPGERPYLGARTLRSRSDYWAEERYSSLVNEINKASNYDDVLKQKARAYLSQLDFIDRAKLGQAVPGGQSLDDLTKGLESLAREIGPDDMQKIGQIRKSVRNYHSYWLNQRVDAGLMSPGLRDTLLKTHPNYIPHNVIMEIEKRSYVGMSGSFNVAKTDVMKAIGSVRNIDDPFVAMGKRAPITARTINKNKLLNEIVTAQEKYKVFPGMQKISAGYKVPAGYGKINFFREGVKESWMVSTDLEVAIKNLDTPVRPGWFRMVTAPATLLRKGATQFNPSFTIPNKFRDKQTAALTSGGFIDDATKRYGLAKNPIDISKLSKKALDRMYRRSGSYGSSIFIEGDDVVMKQLSKTGTAKHMRYANPFNMIDDFNEMVEISTRKEVFKRALFSGLDPHSAAIVSRDASIDFAKMGEWMQPLNKAVPFLNARVQGFVNIPSAFVKNPEVFARMQFFTSVYPTYLLHQHNRRFGSYANISQYFKNRYWVVMIGETDGIDSYTGEQIKVPQFITIPKGEGQQLVANPIQWWLEKSDQTDYRKVSEMIVDVVGSASPMEFQSFDQSNWAGTLISQAGPITSIPAGLWAKKHPYLGYEIIPEAREKAEKGLQYTRMTPEVAKEAANIINEALGKDVIAPAELEFIAGSFGGLPQDIMKSMDIVYNVMREGEIGGYSVSETPVGTLTKLPIARRFVREAGEWRSPEREYKKMEKEEFEKEIESRKIKMKDKAEEIWREMLKKETKEDKLNYLNSLGDELTPEIKEKLLSFKKRTNATVLKPTDSVELRAKFIVWEVADMKNRGIPREEILEYLNELTEKKILTNKVREMIYVIQTQYAE